MSAETERVLADVRAERATHPGRGWTNEHDDSHDEQHLTGLATHYMATGLLAPRPNRRRWLVKAASLVVAAIEWIDRHEEADR